MRSRSNAAAVLALALLAGCGGSPSRPQRNRPAYRPVADLPVRIGAPYTVRGRTYVPTDSRDYAETGMASWYGSESGNRTANGERFRPVGISAAHRTLPLPSYVEVTSLKSGRTILVRVNDRGPFAASRVIDLSRGAARQLGMERDGSGAVFVRRVYPAEGDRAALRDGRGVAIRPTLSEDQRRRLLAAAGPAFTAVQSPAIPLGPLFVQVATLSDRERADALAQSIGGQAVPAGGYWRVRIGPLSEQAAKPALARVRSAGYQDARLVRGADPTLNGMEPPR